MSVAGTSQTVYSGSVFYFDTFNAKSYVGEPTTNTLPNPLLNAYPTYGNTWYTYNVNQYGAGTFFSIGTVSDVANNVVTMSADHSLRTYDVMRPQTTGGGVVANTDYFIKKLSNTTFCLYAYNSSQDGSQGYINTATGNHKVYDSIMLDQKISINASGFPTMWWGAPHLPNSGLVKELIPGGFNVDPNKPTDCIRLHYIRTDGVADGMAYGVDASVEIGNVYTVSFWTRTITLSLVGATVTFSNYNYGGVGGYDYFGFIPVLGSVGAWQKNSYQFTATHTAIISYWFVGSVPGKYDIANIQVEKKGHATQFVPGTRSVTQGLLDLTRNYTIDLTHAAYDSNAQITYNSVNYLRSTTNCGITGNITLTAWVKPIYTNGSSHHTIICTDTNYQYGIKLMNYYWGTYALWLGYGTSNYMAAYGINVNDNINKMLTGTWDQSTGIVKLYINGLAISTIDTGITNTPCVLSDGIITIGGEYYSIGAGNAFEGTIYSTAIYNRVLSDAEIFQNYNRTKSRYGL